MFFLPKQFIKELFIEFQLRFLTYIIPQPIFRYGNYSWNYKGGSALNLYHQSLGSIK